MSTFRPYLQLAADGEVLSASAMGEAMQLMLQGIPEDVEVAGFLMAMRARGETVTEITAAATAMRALATPVIAPDNVIDTAGTGGDGSGTYNISTAAALIAAGAGAVVAKHGNRAATSKSGSSDVLAALGINLEASPEMISRCITDAGVGFMFAAYHHRAVANIAGVRKALGVRTIFNLLGPLTNPAGATRQLTGVYDQSLCRPLAQTLKALGGKKAWVVHGQDGLDELTTTTTTHVCALEGGQLSEFTVTPEEAGLPRATLEDLRGGAPRENAAALTGLLAGEKSPYRDIALLNGAAALIVADCATTLREGVEMGIEAIDSGRAKHALRRLIEISNTPVALP